MKKYQTGGLTERQCRVLARALAQWLDRNPIEGTAVDSDENAAGELLELFDEPQSNLIPVED